MAAAPSAVAYARALKHAPNRAKIAAKAATKATRSRTNKSKAEKAKAEVSKIAVAVKQDLPHAWIVFTDGACRNNPGPAASAALVAEDPFDEKTLKYKTQQFASSTNNIAEGTAALLGLDLLDEQQSTVPKPKWILYTDSQYLQGMLTKGWTAHKNVELIAQLRDRMRELNAKWQVPLEIRWCRAHVGLKWNDRVDRLASDAVPYL